MDFYKHDILQPKEIETHNEIMSISLYGSIL